MEVAAAAAARPRVPRGQPPATVIPAGVCELPPQAGAQRSRRPSAPERRSDTLWQAASSSSTQAIFLIGTAFLLPIVLRYTGRSYRVFRGKVRANIGYH